MNNKINFDGENPKFTTFLAKNYNICSLTEHWALPTCNLLGLVICSMDECTYIG